MISVNKVRVPDLHFADQVRKGPLYQGHGTYRWAKLEAALAHCDPERRRHAVDVGAHVGLWSWPLSFEFSRVTAFEPIEQFAKLFEWNLSKRDNVKLRRRALAERHGESGFVYNGTARLKSGDLPLWAATVHVAKLDEMELTEVDFLKISCEGGEHLVLLGGEKTIRRDKPVIAIEQKPKRMADYGLERDAGLKLLMRWGALPVWDGEGDWVLKWPA